MRTKQEKDRNVLRYTAQSKILLKIFPINGHTRSGFQTLTQILVKDYLTQGSPTKKERD